MVVTLSDIAHAAGVTKATVSMALRDKGRISPETRSRIKQLAREMKYRPNQIARCLTVGHSSFVGVVVAPVIFPMFNQVIQPIERRLQEAGYSMLLYSSADTHEGQIVCMEQLLQHRVNGVIIISGSAFEDAAGCIDLIEAGVKLVVLNRAMPGLEVPQIVCDDYAITRKAVEYIVSLGHRRIAHLTMPTNSFSGRERTRGFNDAMNDAGIEVDPALVIETGITYESGAEKMESLLNLPHHPTAVVTRHDSVAMGVISSILAAGLSVPDDISVIGNGDILQGDVLKVPLTTLHHPMGRMTVAGVGKLIDLLEERPVEAKTEILDTELIVRSSCGPPKAE